MDADLLEQLYQKYYPSAVLYCTALCGDSHTAQDIASEAFLKAYLSLPDQVPSFRWWLLRVCRNLWIDWMRKRKWETSPESLKQLTTADTPERIYLRTERSRCLWRSVEKLPQQDQELMVLHYFSGLSIQEAAALLGLSYSAARQRMVRLRQTLKQELEEQGYGPEL